MFTLQDNYASSSEPTEAMTFTQWGLTGYDVQYWNGSNWVTVPGGSVTGNNKVWRKFTFSAITTSKIRVLTNAAADGYSRLTEIEAYAPAESSGSGGIHWLVSDHLGTPRMTFDQTGSLSNVKRHDYLPFGEELFAPTGSRSAAQGYASGDGVRQRFTQKERDIETGLDYSINRYYSSTHGRFTSVDPENAGADQANPQSWNGYAYALNNPLLFVDPEGLDVEAFWNGGGSKWYRDSEFEKFKNDLRAQGFFFSKGNIYALVMDDEGNVIGKRKIGTYVSDMNSLGEGVSAELARRNDSFQTFGAVGIAYMSFFTFPASEAASFTSLGLNAAARAATGLTTKAAARAAVDALVTSPAAKAAAKNAISRATAKSTIDVVEEAGTVYVRIKRAGFNGYQVVESVIKSDGTKQVVRCIW